MGTDAFAQQAAEASHFELGKRSFYGEGFRNLSNSCTHMPMRRTHALPVTASWKRPGEGAHRIGKSALHNLHSLQLCPGIAFHTSLAALSVLAFPACKTPPSRLGAGNPAVMSGYPPQGEQAIKAYQMHVVAQISVCLEVRAPWS